MNEAPPSLQQHPQFGYFYYEPPDEEFLRRHYERKYFQQNEIYSSEYTLAEQEFFRRSAERKISLVSSFLGAPLSSGFRCLELGVGEGWSLAALRAAGAHVEGVDYSNHGLSKWNPQLADALTVGVPDQEMDKMAADGRRFDLVWLDNVLEHVPRPEDFLRRVRGVLAPGGLLMIEVPNDNSPLHRYLDGHGLIERPFWQAYPEHLSYFTSETLTRLLAAHGFDVVDRIGDFPIDLFLLNDASNYVNERSVGRKAHLARVRFDEFTSAFGEAATVEFYRAIAKLSLGRNMVVLCRDQAGEGAR
jgi:2-polyprenyl-3-methyl-5-hydroxy-6-metoxy-1,4-benzoquinol methylase